MENIKYYFYKTVESTMYTAKSIIPKIHDEHIHCIVAENQTGGIGQRSNKWESPRGNLYCTYIFPKKILHGNEKYLPFAFSTAFTNHLRKDHCIDIKLKWPNDFILNNSKVGGMLCEICDEFIIIGIGLNVRKKIDKLTGYETTTLNNHEHKLSIKELIKNVEHYIFQNIKTLNKNWDIIRSNWEKHSYGIGKKFSFKTSDNHLKEGVFIGITNDGHIKFLINEKINIFHTLSNIRIIS